MKKNRICELFGIEKPIIQGGMVWCSGWRLASAVSNAGGLGLLGAGSMHPETLVEHIHKMNEATSSPLPSVSLHRLSNRKSSAPTDRSSWTYRAVSLPRISSRSNRATRCA